MSSKRASPPLRTTSHRPPRSGGVFRANPPRTEPGRPLSLAPVPGPGVDHGLSRQLFRELLTYMSEGPNALRITFIDIAQMVIFMYEGRDVRHPAARAGEAGEA